MKDVLARLIAEAPSALTARNTLREYLQARVLARLQREGAMIPLAFHGGTALRILYSLPRHSEDLDFVLEGDPSRYDLQKYTAAIKAEFRREGYELETRMTVYHPVQTAWIRFRSPRRRWSGDHHRAALCDPTTATSRSIVALGRKASCHPATALHQRARPI